MENNLLSLPYKEIYMVEMVQIILHKKKRGKMEREFVEMKDMQKFEKDFKDGKFPNERFGQAFCNHFGITDPYTFYNPNYKNCRISIWLTYVIFPDPLLEE